MPLSYFKVHASYPIKYITNTCHVIHVIFHRLLTLMKTWMKSIMDLTVTALAAFIAIFKEVVTISLTAQRHFTANTSPRCNSIHVCSESIPTGLSLRSAEVVVMTAFEALRFRDIARQQLFSSVNSICPHLYKSSSRVLINRQWCSHWQQHFSSTKLWRWNRGQTSRT